MRPTEPLLLQRIVNETYNTKHITFFIATILELR